MVLHPGKYPTEILNLTFTLIGSVMITDVLEYLSYLEQKSIIYRSSVNQRFTII